MHKINTSQVALDYSLFSSLMFAGKITVFIRTLRALDHGWESVNTCRDIKSGILNTPNEYVKSGISLQQRIMKENRTMTRWQLFSRLELDHLIDYTTWSALGFVEWHRFINSMTEHIFPSIIELVRSIINHTINTAW